MILYSILTLVEIIFQYLQCNPPRAVWEDVPGATCWELSVLAGVAMGHGGAFTPPYAS